ncbi:MAG: hypothetical protein QNL88_02450 [Acidobacteriota bacterium]|nr:hypothetical protein [Acidobacteriota bacterium]
MPLILIATGLPATEMDQQQTTHCLSVLDAEATGISVGDMREEYKAAYKVGDDDCVFPESESEVAEAWTEFQELLYAEIRDEGLIDVTGRSVTSVVLFEPDGRIAYYFHSHLAETDGPSFCRAVLKIAVDYRFPLTSETTFSQCGTTHFGKKQLPADDAR